MCVLVLWCCAGLVVESEAQEKKRRAGSSGGLQISQVTTSPEPLEVGNGALTFSTVVQVPTNLSGLDVLEVSALITSPTQRSLRFLSRRITINAQTPNRVGRRISTDLVWDGKDQSRMFVAPGTYHYEVRAKLMAEKDVGILTRMVSRRFRGMVEVIKYQVPDPPKTVESPQELPREVMDEILIEEEEIVADEPVETAADEVEMLLDESTSHPLPEQGEGGEQTSEDSEPIEIPPAN
ncbi:MAG: hypothetical protein MRJ96_05790 [Nitrospirales bacterium]|nr:hypothetical protein [Nitrospirales bacterium]